MPRTIITSRSSAGVRQNSGNRLLARDMGTCLNQTISTGFVNAGLIGGVIGNTFSFSIFAKIRSLSIVSNQRFFDKNDDFCAIESSGLIQLKIGGTFLNSSVKTVLGDNKWHQYVVTIDGTNARYYRDGVLKETKAFTGVPNKIGNLYIAGKEFISNSIRGSYDEVRMWRNYVLTDTEVSALYFNNIVPNRNSLIIEYLLNEGSGSTAIDSSPSGNNGIVSGAAYVTDVFLKERTNA